MLSGFWSDLFKVPTRPRRRSRQIIAVPREHKLLHLPAISENPPSPKKTSAELRERALRLCASRDAHEVAMGASSIMDLLPNEREKGIRMVLNMPKKGREKETCTPIEVTRTNLRYLRRAQNYAVQSISMVPDVEARFGLIKDLFHSVTASNQAILLLERLYNCLEIRDSLDKQKWYYQDALVEYLLTEEQEHLSRTNGEDAIVAGVMLLDRVKDDELRKKLLLHAMGSHPIRNCLMRETHEHPGLLGKLEDMAEAEQVDIPSAWYLPCHARSEDRIPAKAANIMEISPEKRHLAIHRLLAADDDPADTSEKISPLKVETLERAYNSAIQNINNVPDREKRPDLIRHAFINPIASREALRMCERLFKGVIADSPVADHTPQLELMEFLLDEKHLERANGEDAILAGVFLLDKVWGEENQRRFLEKVLHSSRIRDCILRERNRHVGLMNGLQNLVERLQVEIPREWEVMGC